MTPNHVCDSLCKAIEQIDDYVMAGAVGQRGDVLHDELDACVSLLSYVRDRIDDPARYLTLATKRPAVGQLMATLHDTLLKLAEARWQLEELIDGDLADELTVERADAGGKETAVMPDEGETRAAL